MARKVNEEEYIQKRTEILKKAYELITTKGFEAMSIKDITSSLNISKGAFYHYFESKEKLLEALAAQLRERVELTLSPIVKDPNLDAIEKLNKFFENVGEWKSDQMEFLLSMIQVWYMDGNAIIRQKLRSQAIKNLSPLMAEIVKQGVDEGVFISNDPEHDGEVLLVLIQGFNDSISKLLMKQSDIDFVTMSIEKIVSAYTNSLERTLGAPNGSICIAKMDRMIQWLQANA